MILTWVYQCVNARNGQLTKLLRRGNLSNLRGHTDDAALEMPRLPYWTVYVITELCTRLPEVAVIVRL